MGDTSLKNTDSDSSLQHKATAQRLLDSSSLWISSAEAKKKERGGSPYAVGYAASDSVKAEVAQSASPKQVLSNGEQAKGTIDQERLKHFPRSEDPDPAGKMEKLAKSGTAGLPDQQAGASSMLETVHFEQAQGFRKETVAAESVASASSALVKDLDGHGDADFVRELGSKRNENWASKDATPVEAHKSKSVDLAPEPRIVNREVVDRLQFADAPVDQARDKREIESRLSGTGSSEEKTVLVSARDIAHSGGDQGTSEVVAKVMPGINSGQSLRQLSDNAVAKRADTAVNPADNSYKEPLQKLRQDPELVISQLLTSRTAPNASSLSKQDAEGHGDAGFVRELGSKRNQTVASESATAIEARKSESAAPAEEQRSVNREVADRLQFANAPVEPVNRERAPTDYGEGGLAALDSLNGSYSAGSTAAPALRELSTSPSEQILRPAKNSDSNSIILANAGPISDEPKRVADTAGRALRLMRSDAPAAEPPGIFASSIAAERMQSLQPLDSKGLGKEQAVLPSAVLKAAQSGRSFDAAGASPGPASPIAQALLAGSSPGAIKAAASEPSRGLDAVALTGPVKGANEAAPVSTLSARELAAPVVGSGKVDASAGAVHEAVPSITLRNVDAVRAQVVEVPVATPVHNIAATAFGRTMPGSAGLAPGPGEVALLLRGAAAGAAVTHGVQPTLARNLDLPEKSWRVSESPGAGASTVRAAAGPSAPVGTATRGNEVAAAIAAVHLSEPVPESRTSLSNRGEVGAVASAAPASRIEAAASGKTASRSPAPGTTGDDAAATMRGARVIAPVLAPPTAAASAAAGSLVVSPFGRQGGGVEPADDKGGFDRVGKGEQVRAGKLYITGVEVALIASLAAVARVRSNAVGDAGPAGAKVGVGDSRSLPDGIAGTCQGPFPGKRDCGGETSSSSVLITTRSQADAVRGEQDRVCGARGLHAGGLTLSAILALTGTARERVETNDSEPVKNAVRFERTFAPAGRREDTAPSLAVAVSGPISAQPAVPSTDRLHPRELALRNPAAIGGAFAARELARESPVQYRRTPPSIALKFAASAYVPKP